MQQLQAPSMRLLQLMPTRENIRRSPKKQKNPRLSRLGNGLRITIFLPGKRKQTADKSLIPKGTQGAVLIVEGVLVRPCSRKFHSVASELCPLLNSLPAPCRQKRESCAVLAA